MSLKDYLDNEENRVSFQTEVQGCGDMTVYYRAAACIKRVTCNVLVVVGILRLWDGTGRSVSNREKC